VVRIHSKTYDVLQLVEGAENSPNHISTTCLDGGRQKSPSRCPLSFAISRQYRLFGLQRGMSIALDDSERRGGDDVFMAEQVIRHVRRSACSVVHLIIALISVRGSNFMTIRFPTTKCPPVMRPAPPLPKRPDKLHYRYCSLLRRLLVSALPLILFPF
jgi:hypothetical protein